MHTLAIKLRKNLSEYFCVCDRPVEGWFAIAFISDPDAADDSIPELVHTSLEFDSLEEASEQAQKGTKDGYIGFVIDHRAVVVYVGMPVAQAA